MPIEKSPPDKQKAVRKPSQTRGQQRVDAILEACSRLLVSKGEVALTMHGLAQEACTSIGSLYHFFPDKESVLQALHEKHHDSIQRLTDLAEQVPDEDWQRFTAKEVVQNLMQPFLDYLAQNLAFVYLTHSRECGSPRENGRGMHEILSRVIRLRTPGATEAQRHAYTATLFSLPVGMLSELLPEYEHALHGPILATELPRAMEAYLRAIEALHTAEH